MSRTMENLLTWAPLGAAVALMMSDHKRLGLAVGVVSPVTAAVQHPRAMRRALGKVPRALGTMGGAVAKSVGRSAKHAGYGVRWMAS